ncbi:hypothetical protein [Aeromicrobium sp. UC242_57]|uniref:hypothetical protein n=1 Tax=Aeromicrobium sp. UC242_57 TaxID=3374624 RepID=UPI00379354EE
MDLWRTTTRLPVILDALSLSEADDATRRLVDACGGDPVVVTERRIGEPSLLSRRLLFSSGAEIILHDDAVVAVLLHLTPTSAAPQCVDASEWITGVDNAATLDDLTKIFGRPPQFAGIGTPYFLLDGGYVRATFKDDRGWKEAGNLVRLTVTVEQPGLACSPADDDCPTCSDLLVRITSPDGAVDVDRTVASLSATLADDLLKEDAHWVRLADLKPLHESGLMNRVESQLTCTTCRRIICFTLFRDSPATFGYYVMNDAMRRPLEAIPPVEQWGTPARIAEDVDAMQYVDHEPAAWFLVEQQGILYLQARYSYSAIIDDSALIRLDDSEVKAYRARGHNYLSALARRIHDSAPYQEESPYYPRNLYRQPGGTQYREAVTTAIVNHTWIAQQRS